MTIQCLCRYENFIPDGTHKEKAAAKGAFEECYVDLIDQINTLTLVRNHRPCFAQILSASIKYQFLLLCRKPRRLETS